MAEFLRDFDRLSFWLGFVAASLFWFLAGRLGPAISRWRADNRTRMIERRQESSLNDEIRLGNDTLRYAQGMHLGAPLFALDEILIPPRLLAPPILPEAHEPPPSHDITDLAVPNTPDWPEFLTHYGAPSFSPAEALQGGANLVIIGPPGSGKTVALAALAGQLIRHETNTEPALNLVPVLIHAADLPDMEIEADPVDGLLAALAPQVKSIPAKRLPIFIRSLLQSERLLLLLDGLDELSPTEFSQAAAWLERLFDAYPRLRSVATAQANFLGHLPALGFLPIALAAWTSAAQALLMTRWSDGWNRYIAAAVQDKHKAADPLLVIGWLMHTSAQLTPLELTLKIWAALAGDTLGPGPLAAIEAYLRRMMANQSAKHRRGLEQLAAEAVLAAKSAVERPQAASWLSGTAPVEIESRTPGVEGAAGADNTEAGSADASRVHARGALPGLLECGILKERGSRIAFQHPVFLSYLAAQRLVMVRTESQVIMQPEWSGRSTTLGFMAVIHENTGWFDGYLDNPDDVLMQHLLQAGRWLRIAPENSPWVSQILRRLGAGLTNEKLSLAIKTRMLIALVLSGNPGVLTLLRRLSSSQNIGLRHLAALGLGMLRDPQGVPDLLRLLDEPVPRIYQSASLALVASGHKAGLEAVAEMLLSGEEARSQAAAEALANDPEQGHPTLVEAASMEDPGLRRAAVFGLKRIHANWAQQILEKLRADDSQWAVQDAANQARIEAEGLHPRLPRPIPALTHTPWLLAFAAERGLGVAPGQPALEMLNRALREGTETEIEAAIYYLGQAGNESGLPQLYRIYFSERGELQDQAYEAIRSLTAMGIQLPPPGQFGLNP